MRPLVGLGVLLAVVVGGAGLGCGSGTDVSTVTPGSSTPGNNAALATPRPLDTFLASGNSSQALYDWSNNGHPTSIAWRQAAGYWRLDLFSPGISEHSYGEFALTAVKGSLREMVSNISRRACSWSVLPSGNADVLCNGMAFGFFRFLGLGLEADVVADLPPETISGRDTMCYMLKLTQAAQGRACVDASTHILVLLESPTNGDVIKLVSTSDLRQDPRPTGTYQAMIVGDEDVKNQEIPIPDLNLPDIAVATR